LPNAGHFISSYKSLLVRNFITKHSPGANCEDDSGKTVAAVRPLNPDCVHWYGSATISIPTGSIKLSHLVWVICALDPQDTSNSTLRPQNRVEFCKTSRQGVPHEKANYGESNRGDFIELAKELLH
jgi:hypothetical protein